MNIKEAWKNPAFRVSVMKLVGSATETALLGVAVHAMMKSRPRWQQFAVWAVVNDGVAYLEHPQEYLAKYAEAVEMIKAKFKKPWQYEDMRDVFDAVGTVTTVRAMSEDPAIVISLWQEVMTTDALESFSELTEDQHRRFRDFLHKRAVLLKVQGIPLDDMENVGQE